MNMAPLWDLILPAHAKINLGLYVVGKRPDGYHNIETIFQELEFHDTLYFRKHDAPFVLTTDQPDLPVNAENLIWRAVKLLQQQTGCSDQVAIHLEKHIPLAAGLGGGSSNAAATLVGLNRLFQLGLTQATLAQLGARLGSDVSFFVYGGTVFATGRGECLKPLPDFAAMWVVLVNPGIHVSSGWAYKNLNLKLTNSDGIISVLPELQQMTLAGLKQAEVRNMLEAPVIQKYPVIQTIKTQLLECGAEWAMMSGSGSTVGGFFNDHAAAERTRQQMERPDWFVVVTQTK